MKKLNEAHMLENICENVRAVGKVSEEHLTMLSAAFGQRLARALEALREGRIKKYVFQPSGRIVWIVVGRKRDYLVMPAADYCSCSDFYFLFHQGHVCYHIIAQKLAEATKQFDLFEDEDQFFDILIKEWRAPEEKMPKKQKIQSEEGIP
jgi:predicted nucleic acid-binding Zn finger protein